MITFESAISELALQNRARTGVPGGAAPLGWWMRRMLDSSSDDDNSGIHRVFTVEPSFRRYRARFCNGLVRKGLVARPNAQSFLSRRSVGGFAQKVFHCIRTGSGSDRPKIQSENCRFDTH